MILQPKRWAKADDPKYDPIRHRAWFQRLLRRKKAIPLMEGCFDEWLVDKLLTQEELCDKWNVSPREFRDYLSFTTCLATKPSPVFQTILNEAYLDYSLNRGSLPIHRYIMKIAPLYGKNYRHVWEMWETDFDFYPTDYIKYYGR